MSETGEYKKKLMLLDGLSLLNRAFYALPPLTTKEGLPTNGIIGFLNIFFKLMEEEKAEFGAVAFDLPKPTFRHLKSSDYKATRKPFPTELSAQIPLLKEVLTAMNVPIVQAEGFEADDVLGTLARRAEDLGFAVVLVSGDRDLLQIASDATCVRIPRTSKGQTATEDYFAADFVEKMGITPSEYIEVKALMGDSSDNIPGVPGIGEKTAVKIIQEYKNIEAAIEAAEFITPKRAAENLRLHADSARLSKELATIITNAPIEAAVEDLRLTELINPASLAEFRRLELKSLLKKYGGSMNENPAQSPREAASWQILQDAAEINNFIAALPKNTPVAYCFARESGAVTGIALAAHLAAAFIPLNRQFFSHIAPFFEEDYQKVAFDAKKDLHTLHSRGISMANPVFDLLLAGHLLGGIKDGDDIGDVSLEYLKESIATPAASEGQLSLLDAARDDERELADLAIARADALSRAWPVMSEMLKNQGLERVFYEIEMPLLFALADMERWGVGVEIAFIKQYGEKLTAHINRLTTEIHALAGYEFNINSTKQLAKVLFEDMGIKSLKKTKTGHSTNVEVLEKLARDHEIAAKILEYRSYAKLRSTYVDGLVAAIGADGRIHTTFNQASTSTGRLSSAEPNLQNIPVRTRLGRELRRAFVASDGFVFVDADYSQIELRILAELSQDSTFLSAFANNQDIHRITAAQVFGVDFEGVTDDMRRIAKAVNFGIVYGISAFSLADDIKVSVKEAEGFISRYFARYPQVKTYLDFAIESARQAGFAQTIFGRRRGLPELSHANFTTRSFGERAAMNMPVQGSAADIIKIAMIKVSNRLKSEKLESRLILQVHDELLIEAKLGEEEQVKAILRDEMENAVSISVPLVIDINIGGNWYDAK